MTRVRRVLRSVIAATTFIVAIWTPAADATTSATWTASSKTYSCTITAAQPTFASTSKYVTISASVKCNVSTTVTVALKLVEMDIGTDGKLSKEDTTCVMDTSSCADFRSSSSVSANTAKTFTYTVRKSCVSTESDGEEYATKAAVTVTGASNLPTSPYDRTVPSTNQFGSC